MADIFARHLQNYSAEHVEQAFDHHITRGKNFPTLADIIGLLEPKTMYQMDNGPNGFGATYAPDHPYVRLQAKVGTDLSKYVIQVRACEAAKYEQEAIIAPAIEFGDDDEKGVEPRAGGGFRRLGYSYDA